MATKKLPVEQLQKRMDLFKDAAKNAEPSSGWVKATRTVLGMTLQQLANKLKVTRQGIQDLENREQLGTISLNVLRDAADKLDMKLVYGFVPKDGTLEKLIERRAREMAEKIVSRTSQSMKLESQENTKKRIEASIKERTEELKKEMPKVLWD
ncbi:MAG: mobile mystery protein A [Bacteroidetes bacterium]|nr:mobile mystery protein A [Bacteroidota bacterium]